MGVAKTPAAVEPLEARTFLTVTAVDPKNMMDFGGRVVFTGVRADAGREVWISDGTAAGTRMLRDVRPGVDSSSPTLIGWAGKLFYFFADTGNASTTCLWRTDGKGRGTVLVRRFDKSEATLLNLDASVGGRMLFTRHTRDRLGNGVDQLWITDGTGAGTTKIADGFTGKGGLRDWHVRRGVGYFTQNVRDLSTKLGYRSQIWRTDGTAAGTKALGFNLDVIVNSTIRGSTMYVFGGTGKGATPSVYKVRLDKKGAIRGRATTLGQYTLGGQMIGSSANSVWFVAGTAERDDEGERDDKLQLFRIDSGGTIRQMTHFKPTLGVDSLNQLGQSSRLDVTRDGAAFTANDNGWWFARERDSSAHFQTYIGGQSTFTQPVIRAGERTAGGTLFVKTSSSASQAHATVYKLDDISAKPVKVSYLDFNGTIGVAGETLVFVWQRQLWSAAPGATTPAQITGAA